MHTKFSQKKKETYYRFEDLVTGYQEEEKLKELDKMVTEQVRNVGKIEASLRPLIPTKLTKLFNGPSNIQVGHMTLTDCGDLLFYSSGEVRIMDLGMKLTKASKAIANVCCLAQFKDVVFVVTYAGNKLKCSSYRYGTLSDLNEICEYRAEFVSSSIAVCEKYVVMVDNSSYYYCLRVYDHSGVPQRDVKINHSIKGSGRFPTLVF
ncbi:hypothetical protein EB796_019167 [Bugula neritina]|uniref:Uncharacterized protein n=1 Tax=Bugula neritina TaxID=10212 RepID=A0A7J7J8I9_BUGNE|nr:hypothetical protein EB796_019167 [Bugula neritina]